MPPLQSFSVGQQVRVVAVPSMVLQHGPPETLALFARCVGQVLRIEDIDQHGHLELLVLDDGSQAPDHCSHTIYIEPEFVELATRPPDA